MITVEILGLLVALPLLAAAWSDYRYECERKRSEPIAVMRSMPLRRNVRRGAV